MTRHLWRHEWRMLRADATLAVLVTVLALAVGYALINGVRWRDQQRAVLEAALDEEGARYKDAAATMRTAREQKKTLPAFSDPANPDTAGRTTAPRYALLPPAPLSELAVGQSDLLSSYYKVTTESPETILGTADTENPTRLLTGRFDLAFVIVYLYPLFIIALGYNLLSLEKEQGTLALVLSQPVTLPRLVGAKVGARVVLLVGLVVGLSLAALIVLRVPLRDGGVLVRLGLWCAVVLGYGLFWFALSLLVVATGRSSAMNAMTLAGAWLVLTVLLPGAANLVATTVYPVPSRVEMIQAVREATDDANAEGAALLGRYYQDHPEFAAETSDQAVTDFNAVKLAVNERIEAQVRPVMQTYEVQLERQQRIIDRLRFIAPSVLAQESLNDIAGSGASRHRHFVRQVLAFHQQWRDYFFPLTIRKAALTDYAAVPQFTFREESLSAMMARTAVNLAGLAGLAAVLLGFGLVRLREYPIAGD